MYMYSTCTCMKRQRRERERQRQGRREKGGGAKERERGEQCEGTDTHCTCMCTCLLDISRQLACMKLGRREKYQPIQYCWAGCLGYPVHTCHLPIDIQQIYCSAQTGQHSRLWRSCCLVWALQHIYMHTGTCMSVCSQVVQHQFSISQSQTECDTLSCPYTEVITCQHVPSLPPYHLPLPPPPPLSLS